MSDREAIWFALHDALPAGRRIGQATFDPATNLWGATARSPKPIGRRRMSETHIEGHGVTELDAVRDLTERLRGER